LLVASARAAAPASPPAAVAPPRFPRNRLRLELSNFVIRRVSLFAVTAVPSARSGLQAGGLPDQTASCQTLCDATIARNSVLAMRSYTGRPSPNNILWYTVVESRWNLASALERSSPQRALPYPSLRAFACWKAMWATGKSSIFCNVTLTAPRPLQVAAQANYHQRYGSLIATASAARWPLALSNRPGERPAFGAASARSAGQWQGQGLN
jgi:hypothetical protein